MKAFSRLVLSSTFAWVLVVPPTFAQTPVPAPSRTVATQPELDQMLAPIALYPDSLLSQILMASTYPLEVVEAARWSRANPGLRGSDAVAAVDLRDWDPSVKSLAGFPQILAMMDQHLEWTERLGDVFIAQEPQVMDTVQRLRQRAYEAGNLQSTEYDYVYLQGDVISIEPASPDVVYVPYYDSRVVYGTWWWQAYPPVYWAPWPGYYVYPGIAFAWGVGFTVGPRFFFSHCDWRERRITVVKVIGNRPITGGGERPRRTTRTVWRHDPEHRRGVPYHIESVRERFGRMNTGPAARRRDSPWQDSPAPATRNGSLNRPGSNAAHPRPNAPARNPRSDQRAPDEPRAIRREGRAPFAPPGEVRNSGPRPVPGAPGGDRPPTPPAPAVRPAPPNAHNAPHPQAQAPRPAPPAVFGPPPQSAGRAGRPENHGAPPARTHGEERGR